MSRVLVLHASTHGQTAAIADAIATHLRADHHDVDVASLDRRHVPGPAGYDAVVIGARVQFERHAPSAAAYLRQHRAALQAVPTGFFSVSLSAARPGAGPDPNGYLDALFAEVGWRPERVAAFGGALRYRRYGWLLRQVMRALARRAGHPIDTSRDHELTHWPAVERFAAAIARDLAGHVQARAACRSPSLSPPS